MISQGKVNSISANTLTYGKPFEHLPADTVCKFAQDLSTISDDAAWVALDISSMYCHGNKERWDKCRSTFKDIVTKLLLDRDNNRNQLEMHHWHDVVEKLLTSEDEEFAKAISKNIIKSCSDRMGYGDLWHYIKPLIRKIFQQYGREVWPIFANAIKSAGPKNDYWLTQLLNSEDRFDRQKPSVLAELPDDLLRQWCFQEPDIAPEFVASATDVLSDAGDGYQISSRAIFLINNFGDDKRVLSSLSANIGSFGWSGSLVPYYQNELAAFETLKNHENANVRGWVNQRIGYLTKMIEREKRHDEEHDWGIY